MCVLVNSQNPGSTGSVIRFTTLWEDECIPWRYNAYTVRKYLRLSLLHLIQAFYLPLSMVCSVFIIVTRSFSCVDLEVERLVDIQKLKLLEQ